MYRMSYSSNLLLFVFAFQMIYAKTRVAIQRILKRVERENEDANLIKLSVVDVEFKSPKINSFHVSHSNSFQVLSQHVIWLINECLNDWNIWVKEIPQTLRSVEKDTLALKWACPNIYRDKRPSLGSPWEDSIFFRRKMWPTTPPTPHAHTPHPRLARVKYSKNFMLIDLCKYPVVLQRKLTVRKRNFLLMIAKSHASSLTYRFCCCRQFNETKNCRCYKGQFEISLFQ